MASTTPRARALLCAIASVLAVTAPGCCPHELGRRWRATFPAANMTLTMNLSTSGNVSFATEMTMQTGSSCTGSLNYTGMRWSSSCSHLRFEGTLSCAGTIVCGTASYGCSSTGSMPITDGGENDEYTLSPDGSTMTVQLNSGAVTFTAM